MNLSKFDRFCFAPIAFVRLRIGQGEQDRALAGVEMPSPRSANDGGSFMWPAIFSFLLGVLGWVLVSFLGKPWLDFWNLRSQVHEEIIFTGNIGGRIEGEVKYDEDARKTAIASLRRLAAKVDAAHASAPRPLAWFFAKRRYNLPEAGKHLLGLSNSLETADGSRGAHRKSIQEALKLPPLL